MTGIRSAGKTGTAQKYDDDGNIIENKYISSFIGFAPVEDPGLVVLIIVDEPEGAIAYGSVVAAPYVKEVMESSLKYLGIPASEYIQANYITVPNLIGLDAGQAIAAVEAAGLSALMDGTGTVTGQSPAPGGNLTKGGEVIVYMSEKQSTSVDNPIVTVPDLTGMSKDDAKAAAESAGLQIYFENDGETVSSQNVPSGYEVEKGTIITVILS